MLLFYQKTGRRAIIERLTLPIRLMLSERRRQSNISGVPYLRSRISTLKKLLRNRNLRTKIQNN